MILSVPNNREVKLYAPSPHATLANRASHLALYSALIRRSLARAYLGMLKLVYLKVEHIATLDKLSTIGFKR